jgi:hypothetical protein
MPRTKTQVLITLPVTEAERAQVKAAAEAAGLSINNYLRQLLGLPPLKHGGNRRKAKGQPRKTGLPSDPRATTESE